MGDREKDDDRGFFKTNNVVCATECTGLIQGMPVDDSETDSYEDLYPIPKQQPLDPHHTGDLKQRPAEKNKPF